MHKLSNYQKLLYIVILAFVLRVAVRWYFGEADFWVNGYTFFFELAKNIADGKGISFGGESATSFRVPLYATFLAAITFGQREFLTVLLFESLIGAGTVWCTALITRQMFGDAAAVIAASLTAIYPYYVVHDTALQETSLYTFLTVLSVLLLMRVHRNGSRSMAACAGLTLGAAVLTRANLAPFAVLAPLWLLIPARPTAMPWRRRFLTCLLCACAVALVVSPWLVRSYWLTGSPTLSTQSGYFLWVGNNPYTFSHYPNGSIDVSEQAALDALSPEENAEIESLHTNEAALDHWFLRKGLDYISEHPWQTLANSLRKISAAYCWLPSPRHSFWPNLAYLLSYAPIMILGLWGMWVGRQHWRDHLIFYALFVSFTAITAAFFGHTNYRSYLDLYWIVFAAGSLEQLREKLFATAGPVELMRLVR